MPIGPDIIEHHSDVVEAFVAKSFEQEVKELSKSMSTAIDQNIISQKPDLKAKRITIHLWDAFERCHGKVFDAAIQLIKQAYLGVGWSRVSITNMGQDRFDSCVCVRLYK